MGSPAARVTDAHSCPLSDGPKRHKGGPILPPGKPTVLIGGLPAATVTDLCACRSVPDIIMQGAKTVLINGLPAARQYDKTVHGGMITMGCPSVLIGGPVYEDLSLLQGYSGESDEPSLLGKVFRAVVVIVAATVAVFGSVVAAGIAEVVNWSIGIYEALSGKDFITGEKLELWERALAASPMGAAGRKVVKGAVVGVRNVMRGAKAAENIRTVSHVAKGSQTAGTLVKSSTRQQRLEKVYELREKRARDFYKKHNEGITDLKLDSHITGIDLTKRVQIKKIGSEEHLSRYVRTEDGKILDRGEYFTRDADATPSKLGLGDYYEDGSGQMNMRLDHQSGNIKTSNKEVYGIESTAKPIGDDFSIDGKIQPTEGGASQIYIPRSQEYTFEKM